MSVLVTKQNASNHEIGGGGSRERSCTSQGLQVRHFKPYNLVFSVTGRNNENTSGYGCDRKRGVDRCFSPCLGWLERGILGLVDCLQTKRYKMTVNILYKGSTFLLDTL